MDVIRSDTLQVGRPAILDGRSRKTGMRKNCNGVTARLSEIAIVLIAGLNMESRTVEQRNTVANVEQAGMGNIPPQNPTAVASPICFAFRDRAGVITF